MKSRLRNFFMNSGYVAGVIVICGIVMDIGVNITKFSLVTVTESYMDYTSTFHKSYTKCYLPLAGQYI